MTYQEESEKETAEFEHMVEKAREDNVTTRDTSSNRE